MSEFKPRIEQTTYHKHVLLEVGCVHGWQAVAETLEVAQNSLVRFGLALLDVGDECVQHFESAMQRLNGFDVRGVVGGDLRLLLVLIRHNLGTVCRGHTFSLQMPRMRELHGDAMAMAAPHPTRS